MNLQKYMKKKENKLISFNNIKIVYRNFQNEDQESEFLDQMIEDYFLLTAVHVYPLRDSKGRFIKSKYNRIYYFAPYSQLKLKLKHHGKSKSASSNREACSKVEPKS